MALLYLLFVFFNFSEQFSSGLLNP